MTTMTPDAEYLRECGCHEVGLGAVSMPIGYSLWLDADGMYYCWLRAADGVTSVIFASRWAAYRSAIADALRRGGSR